MSDLLPGQSDPTSPTVRHHGRGEGPEREGRLEVGSYGFHAENAAQALASLVGDPDALDGLSAGSEAARHLFIYRSAAVDALRQRVTGLGIEVHTRKRGRRVAQTVSDTTGADYEQVKMLAEVVLALPDLARDQRPRPVDTLTTHWDHPTVENWRRAAVELLCATHVLDSAQEKPWLSDPAAGWYLVKDLAVTTEALIVLDSRLAAVGWFSHRHGAAPTDIRHQVARIGPGPAQKRMIAAQTARSASWFATNPVADAALPRDPEPGSPAPPILGMASMVQTPEQFVAALENLTDRLRPARVTDLALKDAHVPGIGADDSRYLVSNQLQICQSLARLADYSSAGLPFASFFEGRANVLAGLQMHMRYLVDVRKAPTDLARTWWQEEVTSAVVSLEDRLDELQAPGSISSPAATPDVGPEVDQFVTMGTAQMKAVAEAVHATTVMLGRTMRREFLRDFSNVRNADPRYRGAHKKVLRRSQLEATLSDLVNAPAPVLSTPPTVGRSDPSTMSTPVVIQRAALQRAVDASPNNLTPPPPFPAARSSAPTV